MKNDIDRINLPPLIGDLVTDSKTWMDNLFADSWKQLKMNGLIQKAGLNKRSGIGIEESVYLLLLWSWLNMSSIAMFSRKALGCFTLARKDVMYDLLKREDSNWRALNLNTAKSVYQQQGLADSKIKALVLDDSIKPRRGRKMEGVSSHFDHVSGGYVMGQQVLTLGLATEEAFLPLDSQIFISQSQSTELKRPYQDERSVVSQRYREATTQSKPEMADKMIKRALRKGLNADYLVADAWFGTKAMLRTAYDQSLCAIVRMKKGKLKYRLENSKGRQLLTARELYAVAVKREWKKVHGLPWKSVSLEVEVDISKSEEKESQWERVKLLFVRGLKEMDDTDASKKDWALFLSTDAAMSPKKMLEVYSLRWGIEVYFKEAKQHLGFLKEQTFSFASHTASIHLCAIRYLMLVHNKLHHQEHAIGEIRSNIQEQLDGIHFATKLWQIFRAVITNALKDLKSLLGCSVKTVMQAIDHKIQAFFVRSLQLDTFTMRLEYE